MLERGQVVKLCFPKDSPRAKSKTHASFAKDANINTIMARYKKTGLLVDPLSVNPGRRPQFGDFSSLTDLSVTLNRIKAAEAAFMCLTANLRERFDNKVENLLSFISDSKNLEESVKLGLLPKDLLPAKAVVDPRLDAVVPSGAGVSTPKDSTPS